MGQVVVITGVADGMGKEAAKLLAAAGDSIVGFDIDQAGIAALQIELDEISGASGPGHYLVALNITDRAGILRFRDQVLARYPRVDTVLSNVGIGFFSPFEEADLEAAQKCLEINVIGTAAIFQAFIPVMRRQGAGKLIAMSSLVGQVPFPFESIYAASKFAVEGMVMSLRYEVAPFGIRVALIQPAQVSTTFAAKIHQLPPQGSPYRERAARFIARDDQLIKSAPTPLQAGRKIAAIVHQQRPAYYQQLDFMSSFFLLLNRFLPLWLRDAILLNHMDIK